MLSAYYYVLPLCHWKIFKMIDMQLFLTFVLLLIYFYKGTMEFWSMLKKVANL